VKDLIIGLFLGALVSVVWTSYYYNENFIKEYKKTITKQANENVYLRNELIEKNNELIRLYQYVGYLSDQIEIFGVRITGSSKIDSFN
jgi:hypothetical protein